MNIAKYFPEKNSIIFKITLFVMVVSTSVVGWVKGLADTGGKDAQWYPAKLFSENVDFYHFYLENFNDWFMRSVPNYYFQLYYLLYPAATVPWDTFKIIWFIVNVALLAYLIFQIKKDFSLDYKKTSLIFFPFFIGFPLLSVFTNGQCTLLILTLAYLSWKYRAHKILLPIFLSLLTIKYSFGIPIIFGFLLMGYYRSVIASGILTLSFPLVYSIQFDLPFLPTIFLPIKVATSTSADPLGSGPGDLMSLYGLFSDQPLLGVNILTIGLFLFVLLFSFVSYRFRLDNKTIFVGSLLFSLFGFFHFGQAYLIFILILPFLINKKYFSTVYIYLLLFCCIPRFVRVFNFVFEHNIDVKEVLRDKYMVIFNVVVLMGFFLVIIVDKIKTDYKIGVIGLIRQKLMNPI